MSSNHEIRVVISAQVDPILRLRKPFTGDQEQMLDDMRRVEPLRRDPMDRVAEQIRRTIRAECFRRTPRFHSGGAIDPKDRPYLVGSR